MDNYNPNLYKKESQLAFAMGVFETKYVYEIGDYDEIFDEFINRLWEIGEHSIYHRNWMQEIFDKIYDEDNLLKEDIDIYEEYEEAVNRFKLIQNYIEAGCVAI